MNTRFLPYIVIVVITALMTAMRYFLIPSWSLFHHVVAFFIQVIMCIFLWLAVKKWNAFFNKRMSFKGHAAKRVILQTIIVFLTTLPFLVFVDVVVNPLFPGLDFMGKEFKALVIVLFFIVVVLMNFCFYGYYFFKEWQTSVKQQAELQVHTANVEREKSKMHFHNLKNQVNPHFLFNTLTSLDGLIQTNPALASEFVHHLAKVYRYVLEHKENEIVPLQTEVNFIRHYILLLKIRFKQALEIHLDISKSALDKNIVMITLQTLIDNAIKHNILQDKKPLLITIADKGDYLHITNNKQLRKQIETSTKQGLQQLKDVYAYVTSEPVVIQDTNDFFELKIPLL